MNGPYNNIFSRCYYIATYYMQEGKFILFSTKGTRLIRFFINVIALVIIYSVLSNPQVTNAQVIFFEDPSMLVGTSETVRMFSTCLCSKNEHNKGNDDTDLKGRQWIAGVIVATRRYAALRGATRRYAAGDGNLYISGAAVR